ncbi:tape measure protein [Megamonas funiformis]|uniref:tape measure protein n=1 Tax=Megamonas funiformis TaxID=437897 RepID=UPI00267622E7|nr:tape measure protein [Megamonas funiformis]
MKVRELVARFSFESEGLNKVKNGMQSLIDKMHLADKQAQYTEKQLKEMGAFQDKLGRRHSSNGKFLKINADTTQARANILGLQNSMQSLANGAKMVGQALVAAFAVDRIVAFTQAIQKSADEMMNLDGRLRTITSTDVERYEIEDNLYDLSQQNRQGMKEMGNLYFKIANGTKKYGFNNDDFMRATDIVSKSLTIGGASTAEAQSTILQLGQALGSGFLMGDELNSLNENAQPLMQKIAEYFGKDIGELKEMGSERELKSEDIMRAILSAGSAMDAEFAKMPTTIGQSLQQIENLWNYSMLRIEQGTGVFSSIAKFISNNVLYISDVMASLFVLMDSYDGSQKWLDNFQDKYPVLFALYEGFSALKDVIMDIAGVFKPLVDEINSLDTADFLEIGNSIKQIFSGLSPTIEPAWQAVSRLVSDIFPLLKNTFVSLAPFVAEGFGILASLLGTIIEAFTWVINLVADFIEENQEFAQLIVTIGAIILTSIYTGFIAVAGAIGFVIEAVSWCYEQLVILKDLVAEGLSAAFMWALEVVSMFFAWLAQGLSGALASIAQFFGNLIAGAFQAAGALITGFGNAINSVKRFFADLGSSALNVLQEIANAIQNWVLDKIQWAMDSINNLRGFAGSILDGIGAGISNAYNSVEQNFTYNLNNKEQLETAMRESGSYLYDGTW